MVTPQILAHFKKNDPVIYVLLTTYQLEEWEKVSPKEYFESLVRDIIGQQLSGKVADVIFARFEKLFPKKNITPKSLLLIPEENIRGVGMSWSKVRFIKDVARKIESGQIDLEKLPELSNEEVIATLTKIHGVGPWTAEMFLMFTLSRPDIFSFGDLGLRRAIQKHYNLKKEPTISYMKKLTNVWSPYRTIAARVLWRSLDNPV